MRRLRPVLFAVNLAWMGQTLVVSAQTPAPAPPPPQTASTQTPPPLDIHVTVVGTTPLPGVELPLDRIPAPVQTSTSADVDRSGALDLSDFANRRLNGVHLNEIQGNPFQADLSYRGYTASPLLGTPQGLSVYMDGVRLNQPFGDVVSWDLIPRQAIASSTLMPGSNPLFGLNTLGGALSLQTKTGRTAPGTTLQTSYGSDLRRLLDVEHGGARASGLHWYVASSLFAEDGWRDDSPSDVRQIFGTLGWERETNGIALTVAHARNTLTGNALQELRLLDRDYASVYTKPDETRNRATFVNVAARRRLGLRAALSGNVYYRDIDTGSVSGDVNEASLGGAPPGIPNGLLNRTHIGQRDAGGSAQVTRFDTPGGHASQFTVGGAFGRARAAFTQSSQLGFLTPERSIGALDAFDEDARVDLDGILKTSSLFATETLSFGDRAHVTVSGRYNRTVVHNRDAVTPGGSPGSLDGDHVFARLNPAAGVTFSPSRAVNLYAGYTEGSRAPTSIELGCADPDTPCKLPNAMAGDPPLGQVLTRTIDAGVRGQGGRLVWNAGVFHAVNRDDILFVQSERTGLGYFRNVGQTRRSGVDLGAHASTRRVDAGAAYTFLDATFGSAEVLNGQGNSRNDAGSITVSPGDRLPLVPRHMLKLYADVQLTRAASVDVDVVSMSGVLARGNENNQHAPDPPYYLGPGSTDAYTVVNLGARYAVRTWLQVLAQVNNLFDRRYATAAQLGPAAFTATGTFAPRPLPPVNGAIPVVQSTFYAPGAPIRAWVGVRLRLNRTASQKPARDLARPSS